MRRLSVATNKGENVMIRAIRVAVVLAAAIFVCGGASATHQVGAILPLTGRAG